VKSDCTQRYNAFLSAMNKILLMIAFSVFVVSCNHNWKPDYIAYANVKQIELSGLTGKPGIEFNIGYWETDNYHTRQMFKKYTADTIDFFSPGIDITYIAFERYYNPPKYTYKSTLLNNVLTVIITYFDEENIQGNGDEKE
jgi:hypothetical protein